MYQRALKELSEEKKSNSEFYSYLSRRVCEIESAIDEHFLMIIPALRDKRIKHLRKSFEALKQENPDTHYKESLLQEQIELDSELQFQKFSYWKKLNRLLD